MNKIIDESKVTYTPPPQHTLYDTWRGQGKMKSSSGGFTLIETALSIVIASGLLVSAAGVLKAWMEQSTMRANQQRMTAIQQALANYQTQYNRLPCAASYIAQLGAANFGREVVYPATTGCSTYAPPGGGITFGVTNAGRLGGPVTNDKIMVGAVPVRDLGLPDSYLMDTYGHYFTYAVTQSVTSVASVIAPINTPIGVIEVLDQNGNDSLPKPVVPQIGKGTAQYVLIDHGKDGKGAYDGAAFGPGVICTAGTGLDVNNCNFETGGYIGFRNAPFSQQPGANWFDDMIVYGTSLSSSTQVCTTRYSDKTAAGTPVVPGTSTGYGWVGYDFGVGAGAGIPVTILIITIFPFIYGFVNWFYIDATDTAVASYALSPTADAYCPDASYNVLAGGCTQTLGAPVQVPAVTGPVINPYGGDIYLGGVEPWTGGLYSQMALPPQSHPALPSGTGVQGWECNGSSANTMQVQAYAICCPGGG